MYMHTHVHMWMDCVTFVTARFENGFCGLRAGKASFRSLGRDKVERDETTRVPLCAVVVYRNVIYDFYKTIPLERDIIPNVLAG